MMLTWVEIKDGVLLALSAISANKFRGGLTILGVMVGVGSVIGMASVVSGLDRAMADEIDSMGSNTILVEKYPFNTDYHDLSDEERNRADITVGEALAIKENCPHVDAVAAQNHWMKRGGNDVKYMNRKGGNQAYIMGTWPDFLKVTNSSLAAGRFLSDLDVQFRRMVCVLGFDLAQALFMEEDPVGKEIRVNGNRFEVIGVLAKQQSNFGDSRDNNKVIIPLSAHEKLHPWDEALTLWVRADSYENMEIAKDEIVSALRKYRRVPFNKPNNFALETQDNLKDFTGNITKWIYIITIIITSVGLMVGGIGVMNIMLVSVTERTREIGVRKAIGARRSNIILQFLTEAMTLSGTGGVIGVIGGVLLALVVNGLLLKFPLSISLFWVVVGFVVSVSVGLVSGVYPAVKAAMLDPIEALRYE
ncbi:MAG: ABC transporter permease [Candidatus Zixiibacteriota bacterium]|nr:MAG: ABC transporter permease [candidate division Zixibacteria bacterium]